MKINSVKIYFAMLFCTIAFMAIFITGPAFSQESGGKEPPKKVIIKIISDDNGKTTVIDTTMEIADPSMMDSVQKEFDKVIMIGKGGRHPHFNCRNLPQGFSYDFDVPPLPDCPLDLDEPEGLEWEGMAPGPERRIMRNGGNHKTLTDVLGDIPMDRVVSYSIKDRKNGKRIIIDLNDAPVIERQDRVIVIREPGRMDRNRYHSERKVRVYVDPDDDVQTFETPASPDPLMAPPPPAKPDNTSPKKPKI
jgi:hypothetical protein